MLYLDVKPTLKLGGIPKPYTTLVKAGISPQSAAKIVQGTTCIQRLNHIEIICQILNCTPNDLLNWTTDKNSGLSSTHALHQLKRDKKDYSLPDKLQTLTLEELKQISEIVNRKVEDE